MSATAFPIALRRRVAATVPAAAVAAAVLVALIVGLQLWAIQVAYPLRVTSDVPTYLALLRAMAAHPLAKQSLFLAAQGISTPHSTPYMVALALLWHAVAPQVTLPTRSPRDVSWDWSAFRYRWRRWG